MSALLVWGFEKVGQYEVRLGCLPLNFVLLLQHDSFIVRIKYPVVAAKIKNVSVGDGLVVPNLDFRQFGPLSHRKFEVEIVIHCVIVEFLVFDPFGFWDKTTVDPIDYVHDLNCCLKKVHVDHPGHDIDCDKGLELHHILVNLVS